MGLVLVAGSGTIEALAVKCKNERDRELLDVAWERWFFCSDKQIAASGTATLIFKCQNERKRSKLWLLNDKTRERELLHSACGRER